MNVYFTTTIRAAQSKKDLLNDLISNLKSSGHKVTLRSKFAESENEDKQDIAMELLPYSQKSNIDLVHKVYKDNQKKIITADVVICEFSFTSTGLGYDFSQALSANKPVLVITDGKEYKLSETIVGNSSNRLYIETYNNENLNTIVKNFLDQSKKLLDSKFILIIPPQIEQYLNWSANKKGIRKAEIVRSAIEKHMESDPDYKKYLNN